MKVILVPLTIISIMVVALVAFLIQSDQAMQYVTNRDTATISTPGTEKKVSTKTRYNAPVIINQNYQVRLQADSKYISAVSIRLILDNSHPEPAIALNSKLISENWQFPVNEIYQKEGQTFVDIAAVNISPEGYFVDNELQLFTLRFSDNPPKPEAIQFDAEQTIVIQKNGKKLES